VIVCVVGNYKIPLVRRPSKAIKVAAKWAIALLKSGAVSFEHTVIQKALASPVG
jgi:hypothetical protein